MPMPPVIQTGTEMEHLLRISWIVLIPVGVLLSLVLYQLFLLLQGLVEFLTLARYELVPALKDIRKTAEHVESLSGRAVSGVKTVEDGFAATRPMIARVSSGFKNGFQALWQGVRYSLIRK